MEETIVKNIHINQDTRTDSIEFGSAAKNCCIKVYCDFSAPEETRKKIDEALAQRNYLLSQIKCEVN